MSFDWTIVYRLLLSIILGGFVGLERQIHQERESTNAKGAEIGLRTFALISLVGTITGYLLPVSSILFGIITASIFLFILIYYFFDSWITRDYGITTEVALVFVFLIGFLISQVIFPLQLVIGLAVVLSLILSRKERIQTVAGRIEKYEMSSFISYLVIALVVLPLLPNKSFSISDIPFIKDAIGLFGLANNSFMHINIVNPFNLWLYIVLITGVDVIGYILQRTIGQKKSWTLTSLAGGFISSTATTLSLARESKKSNTLDYLVSAAILANAASFIQNGILMAPINTRLFIATLPVIVAMITGGLLYSWYCLRKARTIVDLPKTKETLSKQHIFNIGPALKFVGLFLMITTTARLAHYLYGDTGLLLSIGLAALTGMDAVVVTLAQLAQTNISIPIAILAFIFANAINLLVKTVFGFIEGNREFGVKFLVGAAFVIFAGLGGYALFRLMFLSV